MPCESIPIRSASIRISAPIARVLVRHPHPLENGGGERGQGGCAKRGTGHARSLRSLTSRISVIVLLFVAKHLRRCRRHAEELAQPIDGEARRVAQLDDRPFAGFDLREASGTSGAIACGMWITPCLSP